VVHKGCGLVTDEWTDLNRGMNDDDMVTDQKRRGEIMTMINNVNVQTDIQTGEWQARELIWYRAIRPGGCTILLRNINAHSRWWHTMCRVQGVATFLGQMIDEYRLVIGNDDWRTQHWVRKCKEGESTIHLTLATQPKMRWTMLDGSHAQGSNHVVIK
jgi:hypothetical protein